MANAAARVAFGLSDVNVDSGGPLCDSMKRRNKPPNSPKGPTAMGINALFPSIISPIT